MGNALQQTVSKNFQKFTTQFSPAENGGILNYMYEPITDTATGRTLLKSTSIPLMDMFKQIVIDSNTSTRVLDVLSDDVKSNNTESPKYFTALIGGGVASGLALLIFLAVLLVPCVFCCCIRRKKRVSKYQNICYFVSGLLTILLTAFLVFCAPIAFTSLNYFLKGINTEKSSSGQSETSQKFDLIFNQTQIFLNNLVQNGKSQTNLMMNAVQTDLNNEVAVLVPGVMEELMVNFGAKDLIHEAGILNDNVSNLQKTTTEISSGVTDVVNKIKNFQTNMNTHRESLVKSMDNVCKNLPPERKCGEIKDQAQVIKVTFDSSKIPEQDMKDMNSAVSNVADKLREMNENVDKMKTDMDQKSDELITEIQNKMQITEQFSKVSEFWNSLDTNVAKPVTNQMNTARPQMDDALELASKYGKIAGYTLLATYLVILIIAIIYIVVCMIEGFQRGFMPFCQTSGNFDDCEESNPKSRNVICCGQALPILFGFTIPIVVILGVVIILTTGFVNNEGCRYVATDPGISITDATLNLALEYEWEDMVAGSNMDAETKSLLLLTAPRNPIQALFVTCKPADDSTKKLGLFPALGIDNLINVTSVINQPQIQDSIKDNEKRFVEEVKKLKLENMLPKDIDDLSTKVTDISQKLNNTDYNASIGELTGFIPDTETIIAYLDQVSNLVKDVNDKDSQDIKNTIKDIEKELSNGKEIAKKAETLAENFNHLQDYQPLVPEMESFIEQLKKVSETLKTKVEENVKETYNSSTSSMLRNLSSELTAQTLIFTRNIVACNELSTVLTTAVDITCGSTGMFNRLGAFFFMLLMTAWALLTMMFFFEISLGLHEHHCRRAAEANTEDE